MFSDRSKMIADMTETLINDSKRELEKFLGVTIEKVKKPRVRLRVNVSKNPGNQYRQRMQDKNKNLRPRWESYAQPDDMKRSKLEHGARVQALIEQKGRLQDYDDTAPISDDPPNPASLTAILNILHAVNPKLCALTPVEGSFFVEKGHCYRRKVGHKYITVQTGQAC